MGQPDYHSPEAFAARKAARKVSLQAPQPLTAWYHIACMGRWKEVVAEQAALFIAAELAPFACVLGTAADAEWIVANAPVSIVYRGDSLREYETPTLLRLWQWCRENQGGAVLYCHTKGVSAPGDPVKAAWRRLMGLYVVERWRRNLARLAEYDAIGVDWQDSRKFPHYSGNFWMARADWIAHLPAPDQYRAADRGTLCGNPWARMHAEMWLGSKPYHHIESLACRNHCIWCGNGAEKLLKKALAEQER